ncbi:peptide-methionine (S)-S-oxide reductase, partial [Leptospira sp. SA-E8]|uniref:peptide-methionine (S)-S-oxide reductase n=1 Tax=Leptospira sp. SA-E8 TaxID=3422259 RepID=UPI003EBE9FD5
MESIPTSKTSNSDTLTDTPTSGTEVIVLGRGCFWCTEAIYTRVRGVLDVGNCYSNGHVRKPSYEDVCTGDTGHVEVV